MPKGGNLNGRWDFNLRGRCFRDHFLSSLNAFSTHVLYESHPLFPKTRKSNDEKKKKSITVFSSLLLFLILAELSALICLFEKYSMKIRENLQTSTLFRFGNDKCTQMEQKRYKQTIETLDKENKIFVEKKSL